MIDKESLEWKTLELVNVNSLLGNNTDIYLYGAGMVGRNVYKFLKDTVPNIKIQNFITTQIPWDGDCINGVEIISINQLKKTDNQIIFLCAKRGIRKQLLAECQKRGLTNICEISAFDDRNEEYYASIDEAFYPLELKNWYKSITGKELNLEHPKTFNEKIQWLKLYDNIPQKTRLADKYLVREYIKTKIGEDYLIPVLGVWDRFDDIDFSKLPDQFVLKCNHASGWNLIVTEKSRIDIDDAKRKFDNWISRNFAYVSGFELQYKDIPRKIIAEEYIRQDRQTELANTDVSGLEIQYWCCGGRICFISVVKDPHGKNEKKSYDTEWNELNFVTSLPVLKRHIDRPPFLKRLNEIVLKLCDTFRFVRIDFMVDYMGQIKCNEITFTPASGIIKFWPEEYDLILGEKIEVKA